MKSAVETLSPTRVRLTVEVPFDELKPELDKAYREIAKQVNIPGFRKGKVPPPVIDRQIGRGYVLEQAINEAVPKAYGDALQANEIVPLGQPELDLKEAGDNTDLQFTAEVDVRPEIELPDYGNLEVTVDDVVVTDEEVDEQLQALRERFGTLKTVEKAVDEGDHVVIDLAAYKDGEPIEDAQVTGYSYKVGSGGLVDGIDDALTGLEAGAETTFTSQLVAGEYAGQDVEIRLRLEAVKQQELPELDDDFAELASEFDTLEELKADLRERLERGKRIEQAGKARDAVLEKLLEPLDVPLPDGAVAAEVESRKENIRHELGHVGLSWEAYLEHEGQTEEELDADLEQRVRKAMKAEFVLDKLADTEGVSVGQEELSQHLVMRAQQAGVDPNEYVSQIVQNGYVPIVVREVRRNKALAQLVENSTVTDASGRPVELKRLRPDGSIAEETEESADAEAAGSESAGSESAES
ncbi:MAG TPA: trigger factor [Actinopolymorphaceae bacterium]